MTATLEQPAPPGPKPKLPMANLMAMRRDRLNFLTRLAAEYGDVVNFKIGSVNIFLLNHPDYIKDVLVTNHRNFHKGRGLEKAKRLLGQGLLTSEDDFHRRQRRLAQPAFHRQRINSYASVMVDYASRTSQRWQDGATVDMSQEMMRLTLAIVGKTLFDADVEKDAEEVRETLTELMELFRDMTLPFSELLEKVPFTPTNRKFRRGKEVLDTMIYRMINERRASGEDRGDLLSMLLLAQDTEGDGGSMTDRQVRDESLTLFLAGHETTANALTWTWYLLSQNPAVEEKLWAEIEEVLGGRLPTAEDLPRLKYTEMVLAEAMRLYSPAWIIGRRALNDYEVGGYTIPARSIVLMSQWLIHHDPRYYPDPYRFDPQRWTPQARAARPKFAYFPFGGGPRLCIGEGFAWMEGQLLLATLAQSWQAQLLPGHPVELQPLVTLRPKHGMKMRLTRRKN